jgi:fatty-acyl-CoA synthase/long-chain acyl-CoA synthetase
MTMSDLIARFARTAPDAVAFRADGLTLTCPATHERITRLASVLEGHGVAAGDRVAVMALNSVPHIEAMAAVLRLGASYVPVNFPLVADEVAYALADSGATVVLVDDMFAPVVDAARAKAPDVRAVLPIGAGYSDLLASPV